MRATLAVICVIAILCYTRTVDAANADPCTGQTITTWQNVATPWSMDATSPNPLGFRTGTFGEDNAPPFCLTVPYVNNKKVEVMLESQGNARLCVQDTSNPVSVNDPANVAQCGEGKVHACFPASTRDAALNLVVFCDTACNTGMVSFWHRVRVSEVAWTDNNDDALTNLEMWCMMQDLRNDTIFPSDLLQSYPDVEPSTSTDAANSLTIQPLLLALPLLAAIAALFR